MISFSERIYGQLKKVPKGKITTYRDLARSIGSNAFRAVGQVMKKNPYAPEVPCHRVVSSDGSIGGFMGTRSGDLIEKKKEMLLDEAIEFEGKKIKNFEQVLFRF